MISLLGCSGIADIAGEPVHVSVIGEFSSGRLVVQELSGDRKHIIARNAFLDQLALTPLDVSDETRVAALSLAQALERAKAMVGEDRLLGQEDYHLLSEELDDADKYSFAIGLVENGVKVRSAGKKQAGVNVVDGPYEDSTGPQGLAQGLGMDSPDQPGLLPWGPQDEGVSSDSGHSENSYPWPRQIEGQVGGNPRIYDDDYRLCERCGFKHDMRDCECNHGNSFPKCPCCRCRGKAVDEPDPDELIRQSETENVDTVCTSCGNPWRPSSGFVRGPQDSPICKSCATGVAEWVDNFTNSKGRRKGPPYFYDHNSPPEDLEKDSEMGWSGSELVDERWAMRNLVKGKQPW